MGGVYLARGAAALGQSSSGGTGSSRMIRQHFHSHRTSPGCKQQTAGLKSSHAPATDHAVPDQPVQLGFDIFAAPERASEWPDPDDVREGVLAILASARAVTADAPWDRRTYRYNKMVFPQMSRWLPDEEREQLCFEFFRELERTELLMAALPPGA